MKFKYVAIFLVLLCCLMGAASATEDISTDAVDDAIDDSIGVDAVSDDIGDGVTAEPAISDDSATEEIDEDTTTVENGEDSADADSEPTRAMNTQAADWTALRNACQSGSNQVIDLTGTEYIIGDAITFSNSATIRGTANSYITGNSTTIPFVNSNTANSITFYNVNFRNINCQMLIQLQTNGISKLVDCTFTNITTGNDHHSVVYNNKGIMNITGCNFTNCTTGYGVVSNYRYGTTTGVTLNVKDSKFENNHALYEPGAINNCGILDVYNCTFINNRAGQWAGAIHTHSNAYSRIVDSNFTNNVAGTNGGALFSYSTLEVINSTFTGNTATNNGGAICGYSYGSIYNITVCSSKFINNKVLGGAGGAIRAMNLGYLTVCHSNFTNNSASNGQAISGITETIDYCNCWNCTCPNCPNCENCTHYISNESANLKICHNIFLNHTESSDTVTISGNDYIFDYNLFINSTQNTHYNGTGNQYGLTNYPTPSPLLLTSNLRSSILGDFNNHDEIYVNASSSNDPLGDIDGHDWDNAYGTDMGIMVATMCINNNGIIHLADSIYTQFSSIQQNNVTIIGMNRELTIFDNFDFMNTGVDPYDDNTHSFTTYINITFKNPSMVLRNGHTFVNCTFINPIIKTNEDIYNTWTDSHNADGITDSFAITFTDCEFKDYNIEGSIVEAFRFSIVNFNNCKFEDIVGSAIVNNTGGFTLQDAINFYDCTFTNVAVKGIVDVPTGTTPVERYRIEGCTGVPSFGVVTEDGRDFVNTTQSRTETILVADIDADGNLFINLTDSSGNAMAEGEVLISINGAEATPYAIGTDGTLSIALADLTDATGKLDIAVTYEENDDYKGSTGSVSTVLVINNVTVEVPVEVPVYITVNQTATSITASDITATAKVAKTLTVTLKDANGNVLASKAVQVTVNGKTSTVTTDKNGVAKVNVNYAKAGTYYYTLSFLGDNDYKASMKAVKVTVNKQATKATFAKKTFKVKAKTKKVTFTLKDAKGKAIKGKKITFTVNKKTYTAKTNAKGIATVKVKLTKKGKYTAVAKFAGDTTYKAISKKAAITVK